MSTSDYLKLKNHLNCNEDVLGYICGIIGNRQLTDKTIRMARGLQRVVEIWGLG